MKKIRESVSESEKDNKNIKFARKKHADWDAEKDPRPLCKTLAFQGG